MFIDQCLQTSTWTDLWISGLCGIGGKGKGRLKSAVWKTHCDACQYSSCFTNNNIDIYNTHKKKRQWSLYLSHSETKLQQYQKYFKFSVCNQLEVWFTATYLIRASTAARRSVFWNKALISCFTSTAEKDFANCPFPSVHRSLISSKLAFRITLMSLSLSHCLTWCCRRASGGSEQFSTVIRWGASSVKSVSSECSWTASSVEISSREIIRFKDSDITTFRREPANKFEQKMYL